MALTERALRRGSWVSFLFFVVSTWGSFALIALVDTQNSDWGGDGPVAAILFGLTITLFPGVGLLITRRQPRNRVGWLLHAIGFVWALTSLADSYVRVSLVIRPGSLPGGEVVDVVNSALWIPPVVLMGVFLILLFPNGHLPSPRWRVVGWLAALGSAIATIAIVLTPGPLEDGTVPLDANPLAFSAPSSHSMLVLLAIGLPMIPVSIIAAAASVVVRFRRVRGAERLQLKWLMTAGLFIATVYVATMALSLFGFSRSGDTDAHWMLTLQSAAIVLFGLIPIAIGIAVTRHGLFEIDALISRALVVGLLGVFITAVYVGIVVGLGAAIGQHRPSVWLSVVATALVAVAFQPVRERVQRVVNRLVYGSRATPYEVLSDFAVRMAGRYTTGELMPRVAQTVSECLGGARVEVWLRNGAQLVREASWPEAGLAEARVSGTTAGEDLSGLPGDLVVPVRHRGELLGAIAVSRPAAEPVTPAEHAMLEHVASQAGLVLRNLRLVDDLHSSRQRLVTAQDEQRRRLERDLHDGAQQSLVSVALMLRMAAGQKDPEALCTSVSQAADELQRAIAELRELARGIHPAILTDRGLGPALTSLTERCPVPVQIEGSVSRRLPGPVEGTLYFVVAESLTNVAKYAHARLVTVRLEDHGDTVSLEVSDDGVGGADQSAGSGLLGLADRAAVVDGTFSVHSPPGLGTRISCVVPVPAPFEAQQPTRMLLPEPAR